MNTNPLTLPSTKEESWKYTDLSLLAKKTFAPAVLPAQEECNEWINKIINEKIVAENYLIYINNALAASHLTPTIKKTTLHKNYALYNPADYFESLNHTYHQQKPLDAYCICASEQKTHLQIIHINTSSDWSVPCLHISLEDQANADITEIFLSELDSVTNSTNYITVGSNAQLNYTKIQQENSQAFHIGRTYLTVLENGFAQTRTISLGSRLARSDIFVNLSQPEASCDLQGAYISQQRAVLDHHTEIRHLSPHTTSRELYKGILLDKSRAVFNGKVFVAPEAHKTIAEQANHNLLLSSEAEIDTKPELEIYHDDVKCTHGATIGQLDANALFYLRSRGLDETTAKKILIQAFIEPLFQPLDNIHPLLRNKLCLSRDNLLI